MSLIRILSLHAFYHSLNILKLSPHLLTALIPAKKFMEATATIVLWSFDQELWWPGVIQNTEVSCHIRIRKR